MSMHHSERNTRTLLPLSQAPSAPIPDLRVGRDLTLRESEVLEGVFDGLTDRQIAARLELSYTRVRQLVESSFSKLGVRSRNQLIALLWKHLRGQEAIAV